MNIRKKAKKGLTALVLSCAMLGTASYAQSEEKEKTKNLSLTTNVEHVQGSDPYLDVNFMFKLPRDINGFTFLYAKEGKGFYFGKTSLSKEINEYIAPRAEFIHTDKRAVASVGIGAQTDFNIPNGKIFVKALPFWVDTDTGEMQKKSTIGYFGGARIWRNFFAEGFAEWNVQTGDLGYGETRLVYKSNGFHVGYEAGMIKKEDGGIFPNLDHRIIAGYTINIGE